ncbi:uncharacterized [Tachysurus ichikawai]
MRTEKTKTCRGQVVEIAGVCERGASADSGPEGSRLPVKVYVHFLNLYFSPAPFSGFVLRSSAYPHFLLSFIIICNFMSAMLLRINWPTALEMLKNLTSEPHSSICPSLSLE